MAVTAPPFLWSSQQILFIDQVPGPSTKTFKSISISVNKLIQPIGRLIQLDSIMNTSQLFSDYQIVPIF